jgi:hypothetical protein
MIWLILRKFLALLLIGWGLDVPAALEPGGLAARRSHYWIKGNDQWVAQVRDQKQFPGAIVYGASRVGVYE